MSADAAFQPGERVAIRAKPDGPPTFGPYTVVGEHSPGQFHLRDDYGAEHYTAGAPAHLMVHLTEEQDLEWRIRDARVRVEVAIRLGSAWPVPRAARTVREQLATGRLHLVVCETHDAGEWLSLDGTCPHCGHPGLASREVDVIKLIRVAGECRSAVRDALADLDEVLDA